MNHLTLVCVCIMAICNTIMATWAAIDWYIARRNRARQELELLQRALEDWKHRDYTLPGNHTLPSDGRRPLI